MIISRKVWAVVIAGTLIIGYGSGVCAAGNAEEGAVKFESCAGCHGHPGAANAYPRYKVPKIGAQHAGYIVSALKAYSSGSRRHGSMEGNAMGLTEQDREDIAAYLEKTEYTESDTPITGDVAAGEEKSESCSACHGKGGNSTDQTFPRIGGQYESYLVKVLRDYKSGDRDNPIMSGMVKGLSEDDIKNISAYYASQSNGLSVLNY